MQATNTPACRQKRITARLSQALHPTYLLVDNESSDHRVPKGSETHFKITAVSEKFVSLSRLARHRLLNELLATEFTTGMHALSLALFTPQEWEQSGQHLNPSPPCQKLSHRSRYPE